MKILRFLKKDRKLSPFREEEFLKSILNHFVLLLKANNEVLECMADMEEKASGRFLFDFRYIRGTANLIAAKVKEMIDYLTAIAPKKYEELKEVHNRVHAATGEVLERPRRALSAAYTVGLRQITEEMLEEVGGKAAHLGEVLNKLNLPAPDGFAVTASGYIHFLSHNHLQEKIMARLTDPALDQGAKFLTAAGEEVKSWILQAEIPGDMEEVLKESSAKLLDKENQSLGLALRSSAMMEDGQFSFAGQYATFLNVSPQEVGQKYKEIAASQFSSRALSYMKNRGLIEEDITMGVLCQKLIRARVSGVLFTTHWDPDHGETVMVNAVWGLGKFVVDGTISPDLYILDKRTGRGIIQKIATKERMLLPGRGGGVEEESVPDFLKSQPCLEPKYLRTLWEWALILEKHFHRPQDVEWALDEEGRMYILQTRGLRAAERLEEKKTPRIQSPQHPVLLEGGTEGSYGVASGPVFLVRSEEDLNQFPPGAILVSHHTSPAFGTVMDRAAAIVTDIGSSTGHMSILAREFKIPTLVDIQKATQVLKEHQEITVDACNGLIYEGRIEELLHPAGPILLLPPDAPVLRRLKEVLKFISPLHLTDPKAKDFNAHSCQTFHDITRFIHERVIEEMFHLGDREGIQDIKAVPIKTSIPLNLYALDLGGGFSRENVKPPFLPENILSIPFRALWKGISHPGIRWAGPVGVDLKGLFSVMGQSATRPEEGFLGRTLTLVSLHYLNFSSHLGYHFSTVDSYCSPVPNDNYITFMFKGGGAEGIRRGRRARALGVILDRSGFEVMIKEDLVRARYNKFPQSMTAQKLDSLGRLMGCFRQLDMTMSDENMADWYIQSFLSGNYSFQREK